MSDLTACISALWRYPVKSCAGEAVDTLALDAEGWPVGDRGWGVVNGDGELTWMGAFPRLAWVHASLADGGLTLRADAHTLTLPVDGGNAVTVNAWNDGIKGFDAIQAWDAGDAAAALLRATTGEPLRLVRLSHDAQRRPLLNALHLVSDTSLQAWRDATTQPLAGAAQRARPNVVLTAADDGELPPFIEDLMTQARIGALTLDRTSVCVRCVMPTVDPATAEPQPPAMDALVRLSAERAPGAPVQFGIYARGRGAGTLRVGDRVALSLDFSAG